MAKGSSGKQPNRLRLERERRGWTREKVAEELGINDGTLARWERGETRPQQFNIQKLCEFYQKDAYELGLVAEESRPSPKEAPTQEKERSHGEESFQDDTTWKRATENASSLRITFPIPQQTILRSFLRSNRHLLLMVSSGFLASIMCVMVAVQLRSVLSYIGNPAIRGIVNYALLIMFCGISGFIPAKMIKDQIRGFLPGTIVGIVIICISPSIAGHPLSIISLVFCVLFIGCGGLFSLLGTRLAKRPSQSSL